jgi:hypothetical protein
LKPICWYTRQPDYPALNREITSERLQQRRALLKKLQAQWDVEIPVREIELQLSGLKFDQNVKTTLDLADDVPQTQRPWSMLRCSSFFALWATKILAVSNAEGGLASDYKRWNPARGSDG